MLQVKLAAEVANYTINVAEGVTSLADALNKGVFGVGATALPEEAYRCGARIVIVNDSPTQLDRRAILKLDSLSDTFTQLCDLLDGSIP